MPDLKSFIVQKSMIFKPRSSFAGFDGYIITHNTIGGNIMKSLSLLKIKAENYCNSRGHKMQWEPFFESFTYKHNNQAARATCQNCGMHVACNSHPAPNDINIGGEAVALNCPTS